MSDVDDDFMLEDEEDYGLVSAEFFFLSFVTFCLTQPNFHSKVMSMGNT